MAVERLEEVIEAWGLDFHLGSVLKYIARQGHKDSAVKDLGKAVWYLQRKIALLEGTAGEPSAQV